MGFANRAIVAAGLGFAVSALVGCGGSGDLLSPNQASQLSGQLAQAQQYLGDEQCGDAKQAIADFRSQVDSLSSVSQTLIDNLNQGASTIAQLAARDCPVRTVTSSRTTKTSTTPTTTTQTSTTPTTTTDTVTTTTTTVTTPTTTTQTSTTPTTTTTLTVPPPSGGTGFGTTTTSSTTSGYGNSYSGSYPGDGNDGQ